MEAAPATFAGTSRFDLLRRDMHLYAWAVRYRRGQAIGGSEGDAFVAEAAAWMGRQEIKSVPRVVDLLAPGPWRPSP